VAPISSDVGFWESQETRDQVEQDRPGRSERGKGGELALFVRETGSRMPDAVRADAVRRHSGLKRVKHSDTVPASVGKLTTCRWAYKEGLVGYAKKTHGIAAIENP